MCGKCCVENKVILRACCLIRTFEVRNAFKMHSFQDAEPNGILSDEALAGSNVHVLILANKIDLPDALGEFELVQRLGIYDRQVWIGPRYAQINSVKRTADKFANQQSQMSPI